MSQSNRSSSHSHPDEADSPVVTDPEPLGEGWFRAAMMSGFVATFAMTVVIAVGFGISNTIGQDGGATILQWFYNLANNPLVEDISNQFFIGMSLNLVAGLVFAVMYGRFAEPFLRGPGWLQGMLYALVPWLLSMTVFFLIMGVGIFGVGLDAGPLPVIGNLMLHLVYGTVLGSMYAIEENAWQSDAAGEQASAAGSGRGATIGLLSGAIVGLGIGWLMGATVIDLATPPVIAIAGALTFGAMGTLMGSFIGMGSIEQQEEESSRR